MTVYQVRGRLLVVVIRKLRWTKDAIYLQSNQKAKTSSTVPQNNFKKEKNLLTLIIELIKYINFYVVYFH